MPFLPEDAQYAAWTPEQIMKDYDAEPRGLNLVRLAEWYKNAELETKINQYRPLGRPIKNPNLFAALKRGYEMVAIRDGHLPTEWRLAYDKRKVENLAKRFGEKDKSVMSIRWSIKQREARKAIVLPAAPTLKQLDKARSERGHDFGYALESRDYWYKLIAASKKHTDAEIAAAFDMGVGVAHEELSKAKRLVKRFAVLEYMERNGIVIPQTYNVPPPLPDNPKIFSPVVGLSGRNRPDMRAKIGLNRTRERGSPLGSSLPHPATLIRPLSLRIRRALYHLRDSLIQYPHNLTSLAIIASCLDLLPADTTHENEEQRFASVSCETADTLAAYRQFCSGSSMLETYGAARVAKCVAWSVDVWMEHASECGDRGEALELTFLEALLGVLWNFEDAEAEMEHEEAEHDEWAQAIMDNHEEDEGVAMED